MPLPQVNGWIIDYRTADQIFTSKSNVRIAHCIDCCRDSTLRICHFEEHLFRQNPALKEPFILEQNVIFEPDDDVYDRCQAVHSHPLCNNLLTGNRAAPFITAIAAAKNFGVIANLGSNKFTSVHDLCHVYGVHVLTADQYFALV